MSGTNPLQYRVDSNLLTRYGFTDGRFLNLLEWLFPNQWAQYKTEQTLPIAFYFSHDLDEDRVSVKVAGSATTLFEFQVDHDHCDKDKTYQQALFHHLAELHRCNHYKWGNRIHHMFDGIAESLRMINPKFGRSQKFQNTVVFNATPTNSFIVAQPTFSDEIKLDRELTDAEIYSLSKYLHRGLGWQLECWFTQARCLMNSQGGLEVILKYGLRPAHGVEGLDLFFLVGWTDSLGGKHTLRLALYGTVVNLRTGHLFKHLSSMLDTME